MTQLQDSLQLLEITGQTLKAIASVRTYVSSETLDESRRLYRAQLKEVTAFFREPVKAIVPVPRAKPVFEELEDPPVTESEVGGCKALLLEIIRRASYDWVLYRTSKVLQKRRLAEDAFNWLFKEGPGQVEWLERASAKKEITSFIAICESLELGVDMVRNHIRRLTVKNVMSIGRPAEYRRQEQWQEADDSYQTSMGDRALSEVVGYDDMSSFEDMGGSDF